MEFQKDLLDMMKSCQVKEEALSIIKHIKKSSKKIKKLCKELSKDEYNELDINEIINNVSRGD